MCQLPNAGSPSTSDANASVHPLSLECESRCCSKDDDGERPCYRVSTVCLPPSKYDKRASEKRVLALTHPASFAAMHWFDVDDWRSVDGFDGADSQAVLLDLANGDAMKAERIWAVGRSCRKYAAKWPGPV